MEDIFLDVPTAGRETFHLKSTSGSSVKIQTFFKLKVSFSKPTKFDDIEMDVVEDTENVVAHLIQTETMIDIVFRS